MSGVVQVVADVGNTRIKCAPIGAGGLPLSLVSMPAASQENWAASLDSLGEPRGQIWAIASVNPKAEARLSEVIAGRGGIVSLRIRSAADVAVASLLEQPAKTGADRALGVLAALDLHEGRGPGLVISCGTAITVDRVGPDGVWQGGAIAPGATPTLAALHSLTAQLLAVRIDRELTDAKSPPPAWGRATYPAMVSGAFWGLVGAVRELIARQSIGFQVPPWIVWTGGDAPGIAAQFDDGIAEFIPDLVLRGLARTVAQDATRSNLS